MEDKEKKYQQATSCYGNNNQRNLMINGCVVTVRFSQEKNLLVQQRVINILTQSYLNDLCQT